LCAILGSTVLKIDVEILESIQRRAERPKIWVPQGGQLLTAREPETAGP